MRRSDEQSAARRVRHAALESRHPGNSDPRSPSRAPQDEQARESQPSTVEASPDNSAPGRHGAFDRLQHIRSALSDLEAAGMMSNEQSTRQSSTSNAGPDMGPSHSAIVLSSEDGPTSVSAETLPDRLDNLESELPEYMHATTSMMQNLTRTRRGGGQTLNPTSPTASSSSSSSFFRRPASAIANPPRTLGRIGRWAMRDAGSMPPLESRSTLTLPAWRVAHRNDDSASTLLGRRVASRAAAAARASGATTSEHRRRVVPSPSSVWQDNAGTSGVFIPPRSNTVARLTAQFDAAPSPVVRSSDSDGSETEVDNYVSPQMVRLPTIYNNSLSERIARQRRRGGSRPSASLVEAVPISPSSSAGLSSSEGSPQQVEEERPATVVSRARNVYRHWNHLGNTLSDTRSITGPTTSSSTDGGDLDGALFSRRTEGRQEGDNFIQEVVDEEEGRSYRIRRRINASGDEQVYQLNADAWWDAENYPDPFFPSSSSVDAMRESVGGDAEQRLLSAGQAATYTGSGNMDRLAHLYDTRNQGQQSETDLPPLITDTPSTSANMTTRRRRGWARLDANGDEIPTDEEDEEIITPQRSRGTRQNAWRSTGSSSTVRTRLEYLAPTTRSIFSHGTDEDEDDGNEVRVRLRLPPTVPRRRLSSPRFNIFSDAWKEKEKEREPEQEFFGTTDSYFVSPIPRLFEEKDLPCSRSSSRAELEELLPREVAGL